MKNFLALLALLLTSLDVCAQTPPTITVKWDAITTMNDGSPATGPVTYNLYGGHSETGPWSAPIPLVGTSTIRTGVALGLDCYFATAVVNGVESVPTAVGCVTVTATVSTVPATPGNFAVTLQ